MTAMTHAEYLAGVDAARAAAGAYYDTDVQTMSDAQYDELIEQIAATELAHPDWVASDGLLTQVAGGASAGGDVTHPTPMLSLDKVTEDKPGEGYEALAAFIASINGPVVVEPKLDGMAVRAVYRDGQLMQVVTRGDGQSGEDVTAQARTISGLPAKINRGVDMEVRGEVFIRADQFGVANANRVAAGKPSFANSRNAVAGSLRSDTRTYEVPMSFAAYDVIGDVDDLPIGPGTLGERGTYTRRITAAHQEFISTAARLMAQAADFQDLEPLDKVRVLLSQRGLLGYPIDGAVVKADRDSDRARLGNGTRAPKWALAFKFAADTTTTVVQDIEVSVGRTGRLALRARVTPTLVDGSVVTFASLHNVSWLLNEDIRIGDTVVVKKAGDVIPRVESPILSLRPADAVSWTPPETDPAGNPWDKSTLLWRSTSPELSVVGKLVYAVSRDALDIDGMSESIITALVETETPRDMSPDGVLTTEPLVRDLADLFTLTLDDIINLSTTDGTGKQRRVGEKTITKVLAELKRANESAPFARVLTAVGMRGTGRTICRRLAAHYGNIDAIWDAVDGKTDLQDVDGIGSEKAALIRGEFLANRDLIKKLDDLGLNMGREDETGTTSTDSPAGDVPAAAVESQKPAPLTGMTVVVTGSMKGTALAAYARTEMNELIESMGGKSSGSVSAKTSILVCNEPGTTKYLKAVSLGVEIRTPDEFAELIGLGG